NWQVAQRGWDARALGPRSVALRGLLVPCLENPTRAGIRGSSACDPALSACPMKRRGCFAGWRLVQAFFDADADADRAKARTARKASSVPSARCRAPIAANAAKVPTIKNTMPRAA